MMLFSRCCTHHLVIADLTEQHGDWPISTLLCRRRGILTTRNNLSAVIKQAGYQWKKARVTLTSSDLLYREKVDAIKKVLSELKDDEAFFSIDEFGPFAVKMRGGKALQPPGKVRQVPQWQKSKGSLIVTAALELSRNQIIHFYSDRKNSTET